MSKNNHQAAYNQENCAAWQNLQILAAFFIVSAHSGHTLVSAETASTSSAVVTGPDTKPRLLCGKRIIKPPKAMLAAPMPAAYRPAPADVCNLQ